MKRLFTALVFITITVACQAYDVVINGIYYNLIEKGMTAEVVAWESRYSGSIVIPSTIEYQGEEYSVKMVGTAAFRNLDSAPLGQVVSIGQALFIQRNAMVHGANHSVNTDEIHKSLQRFFSSCSL